MINTTTAAGWACNRALYQANLKVNKLNEVVKRLTGLTEKALAAQVEPASAALAALHKELDQLKAKYSDIMPP